MPRPGAVVGRLGVAFRFEDKVKVIEGKQRSRQQKGRGTTCLVWGVLYVGGVGHEVVVHLRSGIGRAWLVS